ncbi:MAG: M16 family metallopeptidase [Acidobacteriota bacterium]
MPDFYSKRPSRRVAAAVLIAPLLVLVSSLFGLAQDLADFEKRITVEVLDNGWTFIILERPVAPVFSFSTVVDVGSTQEVPGITGLAHMFEHMAFKGTPNIGTSNYQAEKKALEELEAAYQSYQTERMKSHSDPEKVKELEARYREKQEDAARFVVTDEFGDIISREGGVGLNAGTNTDSTVYFYSLPSNKTELFCYLESERFAFPVFREFYKERDVVQEERRLRTESQPIGRLIEQLQMSAFTSHPYHQPVVGYMSDLQSFTITDAKEFYRSYYVPANIVTAVVGDVDPSRLIPLLKKYFGRMEVGRKPPPLRTIEPPQIVERMITLKDPSQPVYAEGYHKPGATDADQPVYDVIDDILSTGRTSRLYRAMVRDKKIAVNVGSFSPFPGGKYPNLWLAFAIPTRGESNETVADALHEEINRLKNEAVTDEELKKAKTRARANLVRSLGSNQGLANQLASYQTRFGDWRELFRYIERLEKVTREDVRRVANETFKASNRTVARIVTEKPGSKTASK